MDNNRIERDLLVQWVSIDKLRPDPNNARTHTKAQVMQVAASIREFGWANPILSRPNGTIIAGHARWLAAQELGMQVVPVIELGGLTDAQCRALAIADNQLALNAGWDEETLRSQLAALREADFDLQLLGFENDEVLRLLEADLTEGLTDPDDVPPTPSIAITKPEDQWRLGDHRLLCGDATERAHIESVLGGRSADLVLTDPPYNKDYSGKTPQKLTIANDALGESFYEFLHRACLNLMAVSRGAIYICMSSSELHTLYRAFTEAGGHWSTFIIWAKTQFTLGHSDYQRQYEPILYGWPEKMKHYWCGARDQGDVWMLPRPFANREHPTMKPIALMEQALANSSRKGDTVLDPFAGSGSTLIACQRFNRRACLIELEPRYVDVICRRWQEYSGLPAVRESDARTFTELQADSGCEKTL